LRLRHRLLRELVRQVELAHRDLDLHARVGVMAEHLGDAADRLRVLARLRDQVDRHHLAGLGLAGLGRRHQDVVRDAPVLGREQQHAVLVVQAADDAAVRALEHFDHLADRAAAMIVAGGAHRGAVAMHELAHLRRRQEDRGAAFVGHQEAVAVGMALRRGRRPARCVSRPAGCRRGSARCRPARSSALSARWKSLRRWRAMRMRIASSSAVSGARAAFRAARMRPASGSLFVAVGPVSPPQCGSFLLFL
jgi:hypothetical protein